jgi:DNA-binding transcriptional ArsR family regulator
MPARDPRHQKLDALLGDLHDLGRQLGLPPMRVDIEPWPEDKKDPDPALTAQVNRLLRRLTDLEYAPQGPQPLPLHAIQPPSEVDAFLVEGFIRPGTTVMLTGPPGAAKSWASRQLALTAGAGLAAFLQRYQVHRPLKVLVVDEDNGPREEWRREERLLEHFELTRMDVNTVVRVSLEGVRLDQPVWQQWLRSQIEQWALDLVILDPISEMHGGKELREDESFRSLITFLKRLKVDFPRLATVLVHHTRKLPSSDRSTARGMEDVRGQWGQTPDVVALLSPTGENRSTWELHKRVPHSRLILEQNEAGALVVVADETTSARRQQSTDDRVLASLESGATTVDEVRIAIGKGKTAVYEALKRLAGAGLVTRNGSEYTLTEEAGERHLSGLEEPE